MRLSRKIAIIFGMTSVLTTVLYIGSSSLMTKYLYNGEINRITSVSTDYISQFNIERVRLNAKGKSYAAEIQNSGKSDLVASGSSLMESIDSADGGDFDYKVILSAADLTEVDPKSSPSVTNENVKEFAEALAKVKTLIKSGSTSTNGIISGNINPYLVSCNAIAQPNGQVAGYFVTIEEISDTRIKQIVEKVGKNIKIVSDIKLDGLYKQSGATNTLDIKLKEKDNEIGGYYELSQIAGDKTYYLEISEPSLVTSKMKTNTILFSVLLIIISILFNAFLLAIIEKLVVKRLASLNKEINSIRHSKRLEQRIPDDNATDEIAMLTRDINAMFHSLEDYNKRILSNEQKYSKLVDGLDNGYALFKLLRDKAGNVKDAFVVEVNASLVEMFRTTKERITAGSFSTLISENIKDENIVTEILKCVGSSHHKTMKKNVQLGVDRWAYLNVYPIEEEFFALILTDVSENRKYAEDMKHLANYDVLTNLQNRYSLYNYLESLKKRGQVFNVYFIDLDNFKTINDTLGHNTGDEVLCRTAQILQSINEQGITVGRLGGDEFLVVMEGNNNRFKVKEVGEKMVKSLNTTFKAGDSSYKIEASIGASLFPEDTDDIEALLKYADIAMYRSKKSGGNRVEIFSKSMFDAVVIETKIREAINNGELIVYFQPIYDLEQRKIIGAEALIRWNKDGKILMPEEFVPIAKKTGDIAEIDNYVLREACDFCKVKREENKDFQVSINASYKFLKQDDLMPKLDRILEETGLNPEGLKFEITEDEIVEDIKYIGAVLDRVKKIGVKIALDDFGVGYSSFSYIKVLPIDTIKIDRTLLLKVEQDRKTLAIISALIKLAHTLNLDVVAEGIEVQEQLGLLQKLKCDKVQGFYLSEPVPKTEFPMRIDVKF